MSDSNEEPYSTIFTSLKHPIRRKLLWMLSKKSMSFSEMLEVLQVSNSFLTYHLDNLGELILKTDDGRYKLSNFGEAALATMTKVEDIPATVHTQRLDPTKIVRRTTALALGIICIVLIASLGGALAYFTSAVMNRDSTIATRDNQIASLSNQLLNQNNTISSLNTQISQLNFSITYLKTLNSQLNADAIDSQIQNVQLLILLNATAPPSWIMNSTFEGNLTLTINGFLPNLPYNYTLNSLNESIPVLWGGTVPNDPAGVKVTGSVKMVLVEPFFGVSWFQYFVEAEKVEPL